MDGGAEVFIVLFVLIILAAVIVPMIFFYILLMRLLNICSQENRKMEGGMVWLNLIPLFGLGWIFYTVIQIRDSLKLEFSSKNLETDDPEFAFSLGLAFAILSACSIIPFLGGLAAIGGIVVWILYWIRMNKYYKILTENNNSQLDS